MMPVRSALSRSALVAIAVFAVTACGGDGGTEPAASFDPVRMQADVDAVMSSFQPAPLESFVALSPRFGLDAALGGLAASAGDLLSLRDARDGSAAPGRVAGKVARELLALAPPAAIAGVPVFATEKLGTTLVYDPSIRHYVASSRAGAPANGVRFILYAVNPITHEPIVGTEIGYADLMDEGRARPSGIGLRLVVVSGAVTYLDYAVVIDGGPLRASLAVDGMVTDGITKALFEIDASGTATADGAGTFAVDFSFDVPDRRFAFVANVRGQGTPATYTEEIDLEVRARGTTIRYEIAADLRTIDATIFVNGRVFATATGSRLHPEVRGAGGRELTADEVHALRRMIHLADGAFLLFARLLEPVGAILFLSTIP